MINTCSHLLLLNVLVQIYYAFAYPFITYGVKCWGSVFLKFTSRINVILHEKLTDLNSQDILIVLLMLNM